jgi:Chaperone of endosialidase
MTKISNQYSLTNILTADLANSRLGINNVSPAYSLDVTGTARVSTSAYFATASGSVGIGTISPKSYGALTISGQTIGLSNIGIDVNQAYKLNSYYSSSAGSDKTISTGYAASIGLDNSVGALTFSNSSSSVTADGNITNTERVRITSAGNVGIGTTNPIAKLDVRSSGSINSYVNFEGYSSTDAYIVQRLSSGASGTGSYLQYTDGATYNFSVGTNTSGHYTFFNGRYQGNSGTELMRITSAGNVFIATTTNPIAASSGSGGWAYDASSYQQAIATNSNASLFLNRIGTDGSILVFRKNGSDVGSISVTSSVTSYNVTSDYRLKEDLKPINGLEKVSLIKVYDYKWKASESRMDGVIAHELQEILPYAVTGKKDGETMQGVDYSKIVPIMLKAIQELSAEIKILKNK